MISIFDNNKSKSENRSQKKTIPVQYIDQKRIVDINKLLNRVKIDQKNETKRKIIFYSLANFSIRSFFNFYNVIK